MSLVFTGIVPHTPTLISELTKDESFIPEKTRTALASLEQDLYLAKPKIVIVLSGYSGILPDAFTVNAAPQFTAEFSQFGDFSISETWQGATDFAAIMLHHSYDLNVPVKLITEKKLDPGVSIPLHLLGAHIEHVSVLPIGFSNLSVDHHVQFGSLLKEEIMNTNKRVAILVSGHFAETTHDAYNTPIKKALHAVDFESIQHISETIVEAAYPTIHKSLLILSGILGDSHMMYTEYSYESPHDVGYLVGKFEEA